MKATQHLDIPMVPYTFLLPKVRCEYVERFANVCLILT